MVYAISLTQNYGFQQHSCIIMILLGPLFDRGPIIVLDLVLLMIYFVNQYVFLAICWWNEQLSCVYMFIIHL